MGRSDSPDTGLHTVQMSDRTMHARHGREHERRNAVTGARLAAGVVALSTPSTHPHEDVDAVTGKYVLLISSSSGRNRTKWVFPKGGWESDETIENCALREAWEEAGVVGETVGELGVWVDPRPPKTHGRVEKYSQHGGAASTPMPEPPPRAEYTYFEVRCHSLAEEFPEMAVRSRKWMTYPEAMEALKWRPEMSNALQASSIKR